MMLPALTSCPSNSFTPRRFDSLSRPFLELPTPFLCAIALSWFPDLSVDSRDAYFGVRLAVADLTPVVGFRLELVDVDFRTAAVANHLCLDRGAVNNRRAHLNRLTAGHEHGQFDGIAGVGLEALELQDIALAHTVLFATRLDDCEHACSSTNRFPVHTESACLSCGDGHA